MRRGLMSWSHAELPESALAARVTRLQTRMREQGLQVVLAHTSFARPAVVHFLTNFTPYWSEAVLVVPREGDPVLLAALTPRVHPWIRGVARLGELISAPRLGESLVQWLDAHVARRERVGVVDLAAFPWHALGPVAQSRGMESLMDAGPLYRAVRQPVDAHELALARRAVAMGTAALQRIPREATHAAQLAAAVESSARLAGAEEVMLRVAPDLRHSSVGQRLEGSVPLGDSYGVELSLAYKGVWVRLGGSLTSKAAPPEWAGAEAWFNDAVATLGAAAKPPPPTAAQLLGWTLESSVDAYPLAMVASDAGTIGPELPSDSLAVFSAHLQLDGGRWFRAATVVKQDGGARCIDIDIDDASCVTKS